MKILYISGSEIVSKKANSVHVMSMAEAFGDIGNDVTLIAKKEQKNIDAFEYYGVRNNFKLTQLKFLKTRIIGNLLYSIRATFEIIKSKNIDLLYSRFPYWSIFIIPKRVNLVYEAHSLPNSKIKSFAEKRILKSKNISSIVFISDALKKDYIKKWPWLNESKIYVAPDAAKIFPTSENNTNKSRNSVGYVGSFYKGKAIEIICKLVEKCPDIQFHLVGEMESIPDKYSKVLSSRNVIKHGYVNPSMLSKYYKNFDIALLPISKEVCGSNEKQDISRWTSPLKLFEYMAHKKCIIASKLPVIEEVLEHDRNSLLIEVDDIDGWVNTIKKVINDDHLKNKLTNQAWKEFEKKYTWQARARNILRNIAYVNKDTN